MEKKELTEEEKKNLADETNRMLFDLDMLNADMQGLRETIASFHPFDAFIDKDYKNTRLIYENALLRKYQDAKTLSDAIEKNKTILGIKPKKRKRKRLSKNKTL